MTEKIVRIGGASGYWGDAAMSTPQLLHSGQVDYIVYDFLAEITMSIMARARARNPEMGYATDFVNAMLKPNLVDIAEKGVKIISNAGGVNPKACGDVVRAMVAEAGLNLKVATILGDDLIDVKEEVAAAGYSEMFSDDAIPEPERLQSINAYLGGFPIAKALDAGADIVITGRSVDSAVTLGVCIHEFGWTPDDWDKLAGGSLAGHVLECGAQATGGNFTDWEKVVDTIHNIGYPIAEMREDGSFICTKPDNTGGLVNVGTVAEQMLYEIGDPQAYLLPDVACDFSQVEITQQGDDRVLVTNTKGHPAPATYKVCATYEDGWRGGSNMTFYGPNSDEKARRYADSIFRRVRESFRARNMPDFTETSVEVIGAESQYGASAQVSGVREVSVKIAAKHPDSAGIALYLKESTGLGLSAPPGLSGFAGGRSKPSPVVRLFSFAIPKDKIDIAIDLGDETIAFKDVVGETFDPATIERPAPPAKPAGGGETVSVPLYALAFGRSGDKGNKANVGVIARDPVFYPYIHATLTEDAIAKYYAHFLEGDVKRFLMPGPCALNFLLDQVLGGGGIASIRNDSQGKGYAQLLMDYPIEIPAELAKSRGIPGERLAS
jgi:hypothetical protein